MAITSLEELKAENAKDEQEESTPPQAVESEQETEAVEEEAVELKEGAEPEPDDTDESDTDDWKQPDGHDQEKMFSSRDVKAARVKATEKADRRNSGEVERLQAEIAELKGKPAQTDTLSRPTRDQFYDASDPEAAYDEAFANWLRGTISAEQSANNASVETTRQRAIQNETRERSVDEHYERAVTLAKGSGIAPDVYQKSDMRVREMIDGLYPGAGDLITDQLIARLGKGSEKVMFNIGIKESKLNQLKSKLQDDPSGIDAALFLGEVKTQLTKTVRSKTNAPAPADEVNGDAAVSVSASKKKYDAAHKKGDTGAAIKIKLAAKRAGNDVSTW